jgi:hypothetical protein
VSPLSTVSSLDETLSLHSTHQAFRAPLQETSIASFRKMVVDRDRPQIPHSLPLASFRKMVVDLGRPQIPHSLPLASFRKMVVDLDRPQIPHSLPLASFGAFSLTVIWPTGLL